MTLNKDFKEFLQSLNDNDIRYLLVGGYALAVHGHPRYTSECYVSCTRTSSIVTTNFLIDLESFKANKRALGRHQDLADLESLG